MHEIYIICYCYALNVYMHKKCFPLSVKLSKCYETKKINKYQVKSPSPESRVPETGSDPPIGSSRDSGRDTFLLLHQSPWEVFFFVLSCGSPLEVLLHLEHFFGCIPTPLKVILIGFMQTEFRTS